MADKCKQLWAAIVLGFLRVSAACTVLELQADGFATNAMYLMHAIPIFLNQNGTLFIDSTAFPYTCEDDGSIMDFFKDEELFVPWSPAKEVAGGEACRRLTFAELDDLVYNVLQIPLYHFDLIGIQKMWWYKTWVWQWIEEQRLSELRGAAAPTIAFHIRGGDIFAADKAQGRKTTLPADYVQAFHTAHPHVKGGTCIFTGDEALLLEQAAEIAAQTLKCATTFGAAPLFRDGYSRARFGALDTESRCQASLQVLGDLEVLARADYFVGSYHSRWAKLVEGLRYGLYRKDRATSVDASADHGDLYSIIRRLFHGKDKAPPVTDMPRSQTVKGEPDNASVEALPLEGHSAAEAEALPLESHSAAEANFRLPGHATVQNNDGKAHIGAVTKHSAVAEHHDIAQKDHRPAEQEGQPVQAQSKGSSRGKQAPLALRPQRAVEADELPLEADELFLEG